MANMLRRVCHVAFVLAMSCPMGGLQAGAPAGKKVVRNSASIRAQIEQVDKDLVATEKELKEYDLRLRGQFRCGNDLLVWGEALKDARERLKALESSNAEAAKVEAAKAEVAKYEGYFRELINENVPDRIDLEKAPELLNGLKRKIADLRALREALKEELQERNVPAKKAP